MRIFTKYLFKDQIKPVFSALFILLSIIWLMQSLRFMDYIINKGIEISTFLWITVLIIPTMLIVILPLSLFAGALFSYKRLNDDNEISALYSAGKSKWGVIWPSMFMAGIISLVCYSLTLYFMPAGMTAFKALQHNIRQEGSNILLEEGAFNQIGKNTMVYIRKKHPNYKLSGILVHDTSNKDAPVTWIAEEGFIKFNSAGYPSLVLVKGTRQEIGKKSFSILEFERHSVDIMKQFAKTSSRKRGYEELYLGELLKTEGLSPKQKNKYRAEFHKRLLWPLNAFPLVLIAGAILIRTKSRRLGSTKPAVMAIFLAFTYQAIIMINHNFASKGNILFVYGQWLVPIIVSLICIFIISDFKKQEEV